MHRIVPSWPKTLLLALATVGVGLVAWSFGAEPAPHPAPSPAQTTPAAPIVAKAPAPAAQQALEDTTAFADFKRDIYPLFTREVAGDSCVSCHDPDGKSQLVLSGDAADDFRVMLEGGYFFTEGKDTVLARITTNNPKTRMPKGKHAVPWTADEKSKFKTFLVDLDKVIKVSGRADEHFPAMLRQPYTGAVPSSLDNQFITYWQLRAKIRSIFQDDWVRNGEDLFEKNIALFGGADFKERFNESSKASASFLSGLEILARDVSDRAYTMKTGPFAGRSETMADPAKQAKPDAACRAGIARLYQTILFRAPTETEIQKSFELIRAVYAAKNEILSTDFSLAFELTVEDPVTRLQGRRVVTLPVSGEFHGLYQELVDESKAEAAGPFLRHTLGTKFRFKNDDHGQRFRLSDVNTVGNVSLAGIELHKVGGGEPVRLPITSSLVQADGAWKISGEGEKASYENDTTEKADNITIPIEVKETGEYEVSVLWKRGTHNASNVLVEVFSQDGNKLAIEPPAIAPPKGEAPFHYDSSADNIPYLELPAVFRFAPEDAVEINNTGTRDRVTASALRFVPQSGGDGFLVDSQEAAGHEKWSLFTVKKFKAYNKVGTGVHDEGSGKGQLFLRYQPSLKKDGGWKPEEFYHVQVNFPGKAGNESQVPLIVHASASSPIVRVAQPARARAESDVVMDASGSYTTQGSKLNFSWKQIDGPLVKIDANGPVLHFKAPRRSLHQAAWVALCRALLRHPDFMFTRPPSVDLTKNKDDKKRLQLVKLALDLVGRPPSAQEFADLAKGATWPQMVDRYLASQEFKDFYFHRIRLYLESQGTESQDEPARLWCYIAFHDLPMQQILTADYTVDAAFQKQPRPAYHGRTGVLTMKGFIEGKPGLPHYNYAAQVAMLFLGYIFEVPPEVVEQRQGSTAASTVDPSSICYSCHKVLTPLAMQRNRWMDDGRFRTHDEYGLPIGASDEHLVEGYPFAGEGLEAFATQAVRKERFIRTIIDTHATFYFGRQLRWRDDERRLYLRTWNALQQNHFTLRSLIRALVISPEYLDGKAPQPAKQQVTSITKP